MRLLLTALFLIGLLSAQESPEKEKVKKVIETLFQGMAESDSAKVKSTFSSNAIAQTTFTGRDGSPQLKSSELSGFFKQIASSPKGSLNEKITSWNIKVDGTLASVWTDYIFYYNGNRSHCGVNSFQLFKSPEGWKIIYLVDTRRRQNCPE